MQITRMGKQKAKARWYIFILKKILILTGGKWIAGVCWGEGQEKTQSFSEEHLGRGEGRTCTIISWPWDSQVLCHSKGQIKLQIVLCVLYGSQKKSFKKSYFTLTVITLVVKEQLPHFSGIQICDNFLQEQSRAVKSSHDKGRIKPLSSICSRSHAKTKLSHWYSYSGQWYCEALVFYVHWWLVVYAHLVLFIIFIFRSSSHSCQTMTLSQLESLLKEKVCWPE